MIRQTSSFKISTPKKKKNPKKISTPSFRNFGKTGRWVMVKIMDWTDNSREILQSEKHNTLLH